jgi:hypothetical protein
VIQSGNEPARHGRISKQGPGEARHVLVEAAWYLARTVGPMCAFHQRNAPAAGQYRHRRRGAHVGGDLLAYAHQ